MSPGSRLRNSNGSWVLHESLSWRLTKIRWVPPQRRSPLLSEGTATLHRYPDGGAFRLREALADRWKVTPDQVILGNGSDEILGLLARTFLAPGDEAVMADQTFVIYKMEVTAAHGKPVVVPLKQWRHDLQAMAGAITDRTRLLFLCNPNNPTGTMVSADEVATSSVTRAGACRCRVRRSLFRVCQKRQFPDSMSYVKQGRNVIVLRTFSKIYGLAGLRIGYGVATAEITNFSEPNPPAIQCQQPGAACCARRSRTTTNMWRRAGRLNEAGMGQMVKGLTELGFAPIPSEANFVYVDVGRDGRDGV